MTDTQTAVPCVQVPPTLPTLGFGTNLYTWNGQTVQQLSAAALAAAELGYTWYDTTDDTLPTISTALQDRPRAELIYSHRIYTIPSLQGTRSRCESIGGYLDMMYVGNPPNTNSRSEFKTVMSNVYIGMLKCKSAGLVRHIGVCNYGLRQLQLLVQWCRDNEYQLPDFAILETHPFHTQSDLITEYQRLNIQPIAYSALGGTGTQYFADNYDLHTFVHAHNLASYTQACIGYNHSRGIPSIVRSLDAAHLDINAATPVDDIDFSVLDKCNIYTAFNNDSSNAALADAQLRI